MKEVIQEVEAWDVEEPGERRRPLAVAKEMDIYDPKDYILDTYNIDVEKRDNGIVQIKITGRGADGTKSGVAFQVSSDTPYGITAHHMRACWSALFRHEITKLLKKQDETTD